jgi:hygromycin-B 7''-O-kinase
MLPFENADPLSLNLKNNPDLWKEVALDLCRKHHVAITEFHPFTAGAALVAAVSADAVIKILQPPYREEWEAEQWALARIPVLRNELGVELPRLLAAEVDESGWSYLIMSRVPGIQMDQAWPLIPQENRITLMFEIGKLMAFVHQNSAVENHQDRWSAFLSQQKENCQARHRGLSMPSWFVEGIPEYIGGVPEESFRPVLLTGEYTPFNLLVTEVNGKWKLTGMIDFADAFAGAPEYDLIGPGVFLGAGDPALVNGLLRGYGLEMTAKLRQRLMSLHLMHRFSHFQRQVALKDWQSKATSLEALAKLLWP